MATFLLEHPVELEFIGTELVYADDMLLEVPVEVEWAVPPPQDFSGSFLLTHGVELRNWAEERLSSVAMGNSIATAGVLTDPPVGNTVIHSGSYNNDGVDVPDKMPIPVVTGYRSATNSGGAITIGNLDSPGYTQIAVVVYDREGVGTRSVTPSAVPNGFNWNSFLHQGDPSNDIGMYLFLRNVSPYDDEPASFTFTPSAAFAMTVHIFGLTTPASWEQDHNDVQVSLQATAASSTQGTLHGLNAFQVPARSLSMIFSGLSQQVTANWTAANPAGTWIELTDRNVSIALGSPIHTTRAGATVAMHTNYGDTAQTLGTVTHTTSGSAATLMAQMNVEARLTDVAYDTWLKLVLTEPKAIQFNTFGSTVEDTILTLFKDPPGVIAGNTGFTNTLYMGDDTDIEPYASTGNEYLWSSIPQQGGYINLQAGSYYLRVHPFDASGWDHFGGPEYLNILVSDEQVVFEAEDHIADAPVITDPNWGQTYVVADATLLDEEDLTEPIATNQNFTDTQGSRTAWVKLVLTEPMALLFDTVGSQIFDTILLLYDSSLNLLQRSDDTPEGLVSNTATLGQPPPFYGDTNWSIIGGTADNLAAYDGTTFKTYQPGTYYLAIQPFEGAAWPLEDNHDTGNQMTIRISRGERPIYTTYLRQDSPVLVPPVRPVTPSVDIVITYDGVDITDDVIIEDARFTALTNGRVGSAQLTVKDVAHTYEFVAGKELTLDINGVRHWGGYAMKIEREFPFVAMDTSNAETVPRYWTLIGSDYNLLFSKRIVFKESDPTGKIVFDYAIGTYDDTIILDIFDNYVDIASDGLSSAGVTRVSVVVPDIPGVTTGKGTLLEGLGAVGNAGYTWKQIMDVVARATGAVYYISPSKVLTYVDAETVTSDWKLTDRPQDFDTQVGYQSIRILNDGVGLVNDMLVWGAGTDPVVFARSQDEDSQNLHGVWQNGLFTNGIIHQATAEVTADSYIYGTPQSLRGAKDDGVSVQCRVFEPRFIVGDVVDTKFSIFSFRESYPIRRLTISFPSPDHAIWDLLLSHEIDQPWSIFEFPPLESFGGGLPQIDFHLPPLPKPKTTHGITGNPIIIDSFSREDPFILGEEYEHDSQTTTYNGSWKQGEHINWGLSAFFMDHNNPVTDGKGWLFAGQAHYILVHEEGGYPNGKPMSGTVDAGIDCSMLLFKIGINRHEKLVKAAFTSASADPDPPIKWQSRGAGAFTGDYDVWGEWVPGYASGDDITQNSAGATIPYASSVSFAPDGAGTITGTVYSGSDPGFGFNSDGGGMLGWTHRYAGGSRFIDGTTFSVDWSGGGFFPYFIPAHSVRNVFYTAVDDRDPATWPNMVYFEIRSGGSGKIIFDKNQGGPANGMVISTINESGSPVTLATFNFEFLPEEEYWVRWYRPNLGKSFVKVWKFGDAEPTAYQAYAIVSSPSSVLVPPSRTLSFRVAEQEFQTYWFWCDIIAAGANITPGDDTPAPVGEQTTDPALGDGLVFDLKAAFIKDSTEVWVNGLHLRRGFDYTEQPTAGTITLESPPGPLDETDEITVLFAGNGLPDA